MRSIISLAHISLDGFMAGPDGDMSFIIFDDELANHTYPLMATVDTAVYGRATYQIMESYWPGRCGSSRRVATDDSACDRRVWSTAVRAGRAHKARAAFVEVVRVRRHCRSLHDEELSPCGS